MNCKGRNTNYNNSYNTNYNKLFYLPLDVLDSWKRSARWGRLLTDARIGKRRSPRRRHRSLRRRRIGGNLLWLQIRGSPWSSLLTTGCSPFFFAVVNFGGWKGEAALSSNCTLLLKSIPYVDFHFFFSFFFPKLFNSDFNQSGVDVPTLFVSTNEEHGYFESSLPFVLPGVRFDQREYTLTFVTLLLVVTDRVS